MSSVVDYRKEFKHLYNPSKKEFSVVDVPAFQYLMVDYAEVLLEYSLAP